MTYEAVDRLYRDLTGADARIRGITRAAYAEALDRAQARHDRALGAGLIRNFRNTRRTIPYVGLGPTLHSAYANPEVQREHFLADPYRTGEDNLWTNAEYILDGLRAARRTSGDEQFRLLGAAAHALQDSYSGGHAWRDDSVYAGDPTARVRSLHVFTPGYLVGIDDPRNTHSDEFDKPPVRSGSVRAAAAATFRMLMAHEQGLRGESEQVLEAALEPLLRSAAAGVTVSLSRTPEWQAERDRRAALEPSPAGARRTAESGGQGARRGLSGGAVGAGG
jgi:hypothetical protein